VGRHHRQRGRRHRRGRPEDHRPISAISSWYNYNRINGMVNPKVSSVPSLHTTVSGRPSGTCTAVSSALNSGQAASTGNYNSFWAARDYVTSAASVHASVFVVHGMNDLNVQGVNFGQWWDALAPTTCRARSGCRRKVTSTRSTSGARRGWTPCTAGSTTG
jgi:hypothetical protein